MTLWRSLICDNLVEINTELLLWIESQPDLVHSTVFWNVVDHKKLLRSCPQFQHWLMDQKLLIQSIAVTIGRSVHCCSAHVDTPPARFKLSWPVKNTQSTWNRWFDHGPGTPAHKNHLGGITYSDVGQLREIDRLEVVGPCLIDAQVPHDVWFENQDTTAFPRIGLQCQLLKEPKSL